MASIYQCDRISKKIENRKLNLVEAIGQVLLCNTSSSTKNYLLLSLEHWRFLGVYNFFSENNFILAYELNSTGKTYLLLTLEHVEHWSLLGTYNAFSENNCSLAHELNLAAF